MRDLSKTPLGSRRKPNFKFKKYVIAVIVLVAVLLVVRNLDFSAISGGSGITVAEAPRGLTPVVLSDQVSDLTKNAVSLTTEKVTLEDVKSGDGQAIGSASRSYGGGHYILTVEATLPDPKDTLYQVWVVGGEEIIPIDYMLGSGVEWRLNINSDDDYSNYGEIWITQERTKDEKPEEHVMEGTF